MKQLIKSFILICLFLISACSSTKKVEVNYCPNIRADDVMLESSYFSGSGTMSLKTEKYRVRITEAMLDCFETDGRLTARIEPQFSVTKGMSYDGVVRFSYYIAAVDSEKKVIAKKIYEFKTEDKLANGFALFTDDKGVVIDVKAEDKGKYAFYIGLQMNEEQLEYNRSKKLWLN